MFCAEESLERREPLIGTASLCERWALVEHPFAWGSNALFESGIDRPIALGLRDWGRRNGVRIVLIKQPERAVTARRSVFLASTPARGGHVERLEIGELDDLLSLDLGGYSSGSGWGLGAKWEDPLYLVCTHGRRDPCCAIQGNPVFNVLHEAFPSQVWKATHVGGDRFAANLVQLPGGIYLGRLKIDSVIRVVRDLEQGRVDLDHYRGRSCYPFDVQATEAFLRAELGLDRVDAVASARWERAQGAERRTTFELSDGRTVDVTIEVGRSPEPVQLTCHSEEPGRPPAYSLVSVAERSSDSSP